MTSMDAFTPDQQRLYDAYIKAKEAWERHHKSDCGWCRSFYCPNEAYLADAYDNATFDARDGGVSV